MRSVIYGQLDPSERAAAHRQAAKLLAEAGAEAEVDWGEAEVEIAGVRRKVYLFLMRACYSGAAFVIAFERASQQAFLEAHVEAFRFFGGGFALGPLRQSPLGGQAGAARPPPGRAGAVRRVALPLPV